MFSEIPKNNAVLGVLDVNLVKIQSKVKWSKTYFDTHIRRYFKTVTDKKKNYAKIIISKCNFSAILFVFEHFC